MKRNFFIVFFILLVIFLSLRPPHGFKDINYVGKSRDEIIILCETEFDRFVDNEIMIHAGGAFYYFNNADEIKKNNFIMNEEIWWVNFKTHIFSGRKHFFELTFKDNKVIKQKKNWYGDI